MRASWHCWVLVAGSILLSVVASSWGTGSARAQTRPADVDSSSSSPVQLIYLTREDPGSPRTSLAEPVVADYGWQGARLGLDEINRSGQFLGRQYALQKVSVAAGDDFLSAARDALRGHDLLVADLKAEDLLTLADLPAARDALILDARTSDDSTRQGNCRANVFHVLPNWAMRADALAQFLAQRHWTRWLMVVGSAADDTAYAAALQNSARRVGAHIVAERRYESSSVGGSASLRDLTHVSVRYDLMIVVDTRNAFGESLLFNSWDPRLTAGTHGLVAVSWHPWFREYAARGIQYRFFLSASREMSERDYGNWLAVSIIGEAVARGGHADASALRDLLRSDGFSVPANKGEGLSFRRWDQQLRQPLLLFGPRQLVAMWPQDIGHGDELETDRIGFDAAHSLCHLGGAP